MVNANKILTVSYGTFSCTLEGFDDPFSTMRGIAEYFRDLAADDRYFGAEPPTPDPEMLHKIAEREIQRRVEARVGDNAVVLRQVADMGAGPEAVAEPAAPEASHEAPKASAPQTQESAPVASPPVAAPVDETPQISDVPAEPESVAAKLARIRAAVSRSRAEQEPLINEVFAEDEIADQDQPAAEEMRAEPMSFDAEPAEDAPLEEATETEDAADADPALDDAADEAQADVTAAAPEAEETAELLDDAVDATDQDAVAEAEEAEESLLDASAPAEDAADEVMLEDASDEVVLEDDDSQEDDEDGDDSGESSAALAVAAIASSMESDEDEDLAAVEDASSDIEISAIFDDAGLTATTEASDEPEAADEEDGASFAEVDLSAILDDDVQDDVQDDAEPAVEADEAQQPAPQVRVMKMSRDEFFDTFEEDGSDEDEGEADNIRETLGDTGLSSEDEEDLIRELVELEKDGRDTAEDVAEDSAEDAPLILTDEAVTGMVAVEEDEAPTVAAKDLEDLVAEASQTNSAAAAAPDTDDASVDRLLAQTDDRMDETDGTRRRSAIAHLKAAVAAVRADGGRDRDTQEAETARTIDQFREDLARVVQPGDEANADEDADQGADQDMEDEAADELLAAEFNDEIDLTAPTEADAQSEQEAASAETDSAATARPRRRMPPLMLVSEQRIDKDDEADGPATPVRPRRVQSDDMDTDNELFTGEDDGGSAANIFGDEGDFKTYVAEMGAEGTQEALEASLAYGTFVEGAKHNSRPQIMRRMLSLYPDGSVTREDGLRAFGVLLREGRIHRVKRGEFVIPEGSRFHPGDSPEANTA